MLRKEVWSGIWTNGGHPSYKLHLHLQSHTFWLHGFGLFVSSNLSWNWIVKYTLKIVHAGNWCFPANCASGKFESWDTLVARILHICQKRECVLNVKAGIWWRFDADLRDQMSVGCLANIESTLHCSRSVKYISSFKSFKNGDFFPPIQCCSENPNILFQKPTRFSSQKR